MHRLLGFNDWLTRRPPQEDEWERYQRTNRYPHPISPYYRAWGFQQGMPDETLELWPGEKTPRRKGTRRW